MTTVKECVLLFEQQKNQGCTVELSIKTVFNMIILTAPAAYRFGSEKEKYPIIDAMLLQWNRFIKKAKPLGDGVAPVPTFEEIYKSMEPLMYKRWMQYRRGASTKQKAQSQNKKTGRRK